MPNVFATAQGETPLYDKVLPWLETAERWLFSQFVGDGYADSFLALDESEPVRLTAVCVVTHEAMLRAVPSLDLVLTLNDVNRLIDLPPHSRNEKMAQLMLLLDMCERRGSGIDRATDAIGQMKLPAYKAQSGDDFTRITLFPKKNVKDMTREERIAACYQHACLLYEDGQSINNMSVRERFNLNKNQTVLASRILSDTQQAGLIKPVNPEMEAKRYYAYIPYYG